ncbi:MAG TPA: porin [Steroidobacteraceae bacterium]|nr:porin [Steroidobacteraceae bacterium]
MHFTNKKSLATRSAAVLAACALGAATVAHAAEPKSKKTEEQQIKALQEQLLAVEMQLKKLADQNQALMQHQEQIEQQLQQQQLALQKAQAAAAAAPVQSASALPGNASALPGNTSALPGQPSSASGAGQAAPPTANTSGTGMPASANPLPGAQPGGFGAGALDNVRLWGYGELYYSRQSRDTSRTTADLARAVFGIGYRFDSKTEFNSEYEVEHAVASSEDPGEFEVEQFYVDRQLTDRATLRAGLFLLPFGFINEHHEPTNFYGMQRNFVETLIIPSTWREGGLSVHGDTDFGIAWSAGVTTGVNLANWDFAPEFPQYTTALELANNGPAPLQATHQELALASARHLSQYVALNYFGLPGLDVGGAVFTGKAEQAPGTVGDSRVTLWEGHARWTPGKFDLSALYAHGAISNVADANLANPGSPNPIPSAFYGYFVQAAYAAWEYGDYRLNPFVRWEYYDMGSEYSGTVPQIPTGTVPLTDSPGDFGTWPSNRDRVWTTGVNFYVTPHVVFKADYQWFDLNKAFNRFDLGLGLNF